MHWPIVRVGLIDSDGGLAPFNLTFYGISYEEFMRVPAPHPLREAMRRHKLVGRYTPAPSLVRQVFVPRYPE